MMLDLQYQNFTVPGILMFCYVCSKHIPVKKNRRKISEKISVIYSQCFNIEVIDQRNSWIPHNMCSTCYQMLNRWNASQQSKEVKFITPTIWKEPIDEGDCYFCQNIFRGSNRKKKDSFTTFEVMSVKRPVDRSEKEMEDEYNIIHREFGNFWLWWRRRSQRKW